MLLENINKKAMKSVKKEAISYRSGNDDENNSDQIDDVIESCDDGSFDSDSKDEICDKKNEDTIMDNSDEIGEESDHQNSQDSKIKFNSGWADAMAKILKTNKPKRKKTVVLAKAKKLKPADDDPEENTTNPSFEIDGGEKSVKIKIESDVSIKSEETKTKKISQLEVANRIRKKSLEAKGRVKPSVLDKDREKALAKVATRGVVQLFNAVRQQQKSLEKEIQKVGPSDLKQEKVLKNVNKRAFLDVLMGAKSQTVPEVKDESKVNCEWSVLRDDFMMGTKLKDWDKEDIELKDGNG